jgi:TPR repeat protein
MYQSGKGVPQDYAEAANWYRKAAEQGLSTAQTNLGNLYSGGRGVPLDRVHAYMWLSLAAARGDPNAEKIQQLVAKAMTPAEITEAQKLAAEWKPGAAH